MYACIHRQMQLRMHLCMYIHVRVPMVSLYIDTTIKAILR